jgi:hypothetical protein
MLIVRFRSEMPMPIGVYDLALCAFVRFLPFFGGLHFPRLETFWGKEEKSNG